MGIVLAVRRLAAGDRAAARRIVCGLPDYFTSDVPGHVERAAVDHEGDPWVATGQSRGYLRSRPAAHKVIAGRGLGHGGEVDSEMIPVGGEHGLVVWQVLLGALPSHGADEPAPADRDPAVLGEPRADDGPGEV
jgi:hypothetical protein